MCPALKARHRFGNFFHARNETDIAQTSETDSNYEQSSPVRQVKWPCRLCLPDTDMKPKSFSNGKFSACQGWFDPPGSTSGKDISGVQDVTS
jgi:hypothetical protein